MPYADPFLVLGIRFAAAAALLTLIVTALRRPWPKGKTALFHLAVAGFLMHFMYLGGVFLAVKLGLQANTISIIVSAQPLLTALAAMVLIGETVGFRKWTGLMIGALGVLLTISSKLTDGLGTIEGVLITTLALFAISIGTIYQKRFCSDQPILSGLVVQYGVAGLMCLPMTLLLEDLVINWTGEFIFGLIWLILMLSLVAVMLLYFLIKRGAATNVASLFFLVPGTTTLMAWIIYDEGLSYAAFLGLILVSIAVMLVNWPERKKPA